MRSPVAHARIRGVRKPAGAAAACSSSADLDRRAPDRRGLGAARLQALRAAGAGHRTRCATWASRSPSASRRQPRRGRGPCRSRSSSISRNCRRSSTCSRREQPDAPLCTSTGATTSFWKPVVDGRASTRFARPPASSSGAACARRDNACRRWKGAGSWPPWDRRLEQLLVYTLDAVAAHHSHGSGRLPWPR